jgi:hypothetical protein
MPVARNAASTVGGVLGVSFPSVATSYCASCPLVVATYADLPSG